MKEKQGEQEANFQIRKNIHGHCKGEESEKVRGGNNLLFL